MPDTTPETTSYLIMGLVVTFSMIGLFVASMISRYRSLSKDLQVIEQLQNES